MKRLMTFACGLALAGACDTSPAAGRQRKLARSKPVATTGTASPTRRPPASPPSGARNRGGRAQQSRSSASASAVATYRDVTLPAGTVLPVDLETAVGSDISRVEQPVPARLRRAVIGRRRRKCCRPARSVTGHVTAAQRPGQGEGTRPDRDALHAARHAGRRTHERSAPPTVSRLAPATKQKDAVEDRRAGGGRRDHRRHRGRQGRRRQGRGDRRRRRHRLRARDARQGSAPRQGRGSLGQADRAGDGPRANG